MWFIALWCATNTLLLSPSSATSQHLTEPTLGQDLFASERLELAASLRLGTEYDTNVLRQTDPALIEGDALTRYFANLDVEHQGEDQRLGFHFSQGGKLFYTTRQADTLLTQAGLMWSWRGLEHLALVASVDIKDRIERASLQDYNRGGGQLQAQWNWARLTLSGQAGWRYFVYKPNPRASSKGAMVGGSAAVALPYELILSGSYTYLNRNFKAPVLEQPPVDPDQATIALVVNPDLSRQDRFHAARLAIDWRGPVLLALAYNLSLNRSNSYGQDLVRHHGSATLTAPLFWELLISAHLELQRTLYDDPILVDATFQIDEDNRNSLTGALNRSLGESGVDLELRYSLYTQEFSGEASRRDDDPYQRQTITLGVGYQFDR